jgi:hypothetical protein
MTAAARGSGTWIREILQRTAGEQA